VKELLAFYWQMRLVWLPIVVALTFTLVWLALG
jgi:hypothetical protein